MSERLTTIVYRDSQEECTLAIVSCDRNDKVTSSKELCRLISDAVTKWTKLVQSTYDDDIADYNVGDLAQEYEEEDLVALLNANGIYNLEIEIHSVDEPPGHNGWLFDRCLVDNR